MRAWLLIVAIVFSSANTMAETAQRAEAPSCTTTICDLCFSPQESCDQKLISYLDTAEKTLDIAIYSLTLDGIGKSIRRAQKRGVKIRIIADYKSSFIKSSIVNELKDDGIPLHLWSGENSQDGLMHHKFAIIDGQIIQTGSYNYSQNATSRNAENQIYMSDRSTIKKYQQEFERLWAQHEE